MLALGKAFGQTPLMASPAVSVLIIVHNRAQVIGDAVRSVLAQTMRDFELIVVDDGSTDGTGDVVAGFRDPRVRLVPGSTNQGIPVARNRALAEAQGRYIAWLDSDDVCHPARLAIQHDYLERHTDVAMIGSAARKVREDGTLMKGGRMPIRRHEDIRALLLFRSAFQQSSIFGRADMMRSVPYDPAFPVCEDVDMFVRFIAKFRAENLPQFLIARRIHSGQTIRSNVFPIIDRQKAISGRLLQALGLIFTEDDLSRHVALGAKAKGGWRDDLLEWAPEWFERILAANRQRRIYDEDALRNCFDTVLVKTALRRIAEHPAQSGRILSMLCRRPVATASLAGTLARPFIPLANQPSAEGFRRILGP